ncbi:MAG: ABC transporter permease [Anaerolineales bacterium]|nr:ABC transporter permease [Anaerolineales bacterium]
MKLIDVALKDMRQSFRSLTGIMFMFVVPILVTALFAFLFGGVGDDAGFTLPQTSLVLVNLDAGELPPMQPLDVEMAGSAAFDFAAVGSMGDLLAQILQGEAFADLLTVTTADDAATARAAVDAQRANVALIIPPNFTDALMRPEETAVIELYQDPTLTIGPAIVESLLRQFADSFAATKIGTGVVMTQLAETGAAVDEALAQRVAVDFTTAAFAQGQTAEPLVVVQPPPGATAEADIMAEILGQIMGGMMIFFAFFTGAGTLQTILVEEEQGTLARLFTTPTPVPVILGGKALGTLVTLIVQVTVLLLFGRLVFGINWGSPLPVGLAAAGIILMSVATGLLLAALLRSTRQGGAVYGGVLTLTGMLGMITIFTGGQTSPAVETVSLLVPQGWAVRGLLAAMHGGAAVDLLPVLAGLLAWIGVFIAVALYRLQRRFA